MSVRVTPVPSNDQTFPGRAVMKPAETSATVVVRAGAGEVIEAAGVEHTFLLASAQSGGRLSVEHFSVDPGQPGAPNHIHGSHDECFYVLAGELTVSTSTGDVLLGDGDVAFAPRGSVHGFRNDHVNEPVLALCISTPAGYEEFFRAVQAAEAGGAELTPETMRRLRAERDTRTD